MLQHAILVEIHYHQSPVNPSPLISKIRCLKATHKVLTCVVHAPRVTNLEININTLLKHLLILTALNLPPQYNILFSMFINYPFEHGEFLFNISKYENEI